MPQQIPEYIQIDLSIRCDGIWRKTIICMVLFITAIGTVRQLIEIIHSWIT